MRKYELLFITHADYEEEKVASVIQKYQTVITNGKGTVKSSEKWGKRRLAYEIDEMREGLYILMAFDAERDVSLELDRLLKIDQDIVRHMVSRLDHPRHKISPRKPLREMRSDEPRVESGESGPAVRVVREPFPGPAPQAETGSQTPKPGGTVGAN